jgi:hypothetical protein
MVTLFVFNNLIIYNTYIHIYSLISRPMQVVLNRIIQARKHKSTYTRKYKSIILYSKYILNIFSILSAHNNGVLA